jgi:DnaJ-class molecular chaperone
MGFERKRAPGAAAAKALGGVAATFGAAFGGLTLITGVFTGVSRSLVVRQKRLAGHVCATCEGRKYVPCATCRGKLAIEWQPLERAAVRRLCACPTCGGKTGLQRCNNCVGLGYA